MIRYIISDVEGVVTPARGSRYPANYKALGRVRQLCDRLPIPLVLCSGRQVSYGQAVIQYLNLFSPIPEDKQKYRGGFTSYPHILENGAIVLDSLSEDYIRHPDLTGDKVNLIRQIRYELLPRFTKQIGGRFELGKDYSISLNSSRRTGNSEDQSALLDTLLEGVRLILAQNINCDLIHISRSMSAVDITPAGVSKATAVAFWLEWLGVNPEEGLAIGDSKADAEWMKLLRWRAAPANGREALSGLDYYAAGAETWGLLEILRNLQFHNFEYVGW